MESFQRDVIRKNETKLIEETFCSEVFLSTFFSKGILSRTDIENIKAQANNHGNTRMSKEFYTIIVTRANAYSTLLEALHETKQTGVLEILNAETPSPLTTPKQGKLMKFIESPKYMKQFPDISTNVMIISSKDCKITCERILEHTPHAIFFTLDHFLYSVSTREGRSSTTNIAVVNCENYIEKGFSGVRNLTFKIVLVTSMDMENLKNSFTTPKNSKTIPHLAEDNFTWDDLSPGYQAQFESTLNTQLHMQENVKWFDDDDINTDNIIDHMNGKQIQVFKDTLPEKIKYYIPRCIIKRRLLTNEIFKKGGTDIYLFKNIEKHKLRELACEHAIETSSTLVNSAKYFSYHFIYLEEDHHFEQISKKYNDRPVHVLYHHENGFEWKRSSGSIHNIQTSLKAEQAVQQEADFVNDIISLNSTRDPVCVSDTSGMGKSVLLAHFTRVLRERTNKIVCFIVINEFVKMIRYKIKRSTLNKRTLLSALAEYLGKNKLGEAFVNKHPDKIEELMFDSFDELNSEDVPLGYTILRLIQSDFQQTRIWVTTRPHMFLELEKNLVVLGSNIQSFADADQISFLKAFWSRNNDSAYKSLTQMAKLEDFAKHSLTSLKSAINNKEEDIAGIPLQCMLIGEVFEDEAQQHCNAEDYKKLQSFSTKVSITSMVNLYERLIENKTNKFYMHYQVDGLDNLKLMKMHTFLSIWFLFPQCRRNFKNRLCPEDFSTAVQHIFNFGILESRSFLPAPRFIHRTFAEYFVAKFVVDSLAAENGKPCSDEDLLNFIYDHILKTKVINFKIKKINLETHDFKNNVVLYFIDALLAKLTNSAVENTVPHKSQSHLIKLTEACAYNDFLQVYFSFAHQYATEAIYKQTVFTENLLKIIISRGSCLLFDIAYDNFKQCSSVPIADIKHDGYTLLHIAVIRGNLSLVQNLVSEENLKKILVTENKTFRDILHECVQNTQNSSITNTNDRKSIISCLTEINQDFLFEENVDSDLPIECKGVNSTLVEYLFICGRTRFEEKLLQCRILHKLANNLNSKEYGNFMQLMFLGKDGNINKN